ncbi:MAG: 2,3-bisphosphoglycerate-independent phosphoglycerate mutase [Gammaproteobacteria bacterium]|jgi:2,3-bisphosphoglycerate-independent phosphoglycerate mutase|nr:2,3-bisphosphoglycerate-independent phosphoglycerate mutase [Gammaproteobacteria bacterium]MBT4607147.1 2,3-bisphosphoglycerate-independent phosphoglycerate mutase [Thiotrichales bacterium]MBT3471315.1 2,3-bisphosphoglycerate-independent phosphoglycerate mutase [Gammaproteobacteria bacterium]MBT3967845.1 2,3-bisphosphoglycerate-independent phosphoglycerate mutase [Gammaproteobacteria bacterium]MBT4081864.1 2,3-bisphosphoglycerate-independent phosphoglycerate mutase [Gammaproteobacteria bacte
MNSTPKQGALLLIFDGLGDRPCQQLDGATPLEYAQTPEMDRLAELGMCGMASPFPAGFPVDTHTGTAVLFGLSKQASQQLARGPVEAAGVGLEIRPGDLVLRANFASFSKSYQLQNRRAGRIHQGCEALAEAINQIPPIDGIKLSLHPATGHRGVLRLRGANLSTDISNTDPGRSDLYTPTQCQPLTAEAAAIRTAAIINRWSQAVFEVLEPHPINQQRQQQGLPPANGVILRGAGQFHAQRNLIKELGVNPLVITAEATVLGLAALCDFDSLTHPSFTAMPDTNIQGKVEAAQQALSEYPLVILHFKAPDICAHDYDPVAKAHFIEQVDRALPSLTQHASAVMVTADHSTSSESGHHCGDPVPSLLYYPGGRKDRCHTFSEVSCMQGGLGNISSSSLLMMLLDGMGCMHNYRVKDRWMLQ